jgi:predicted nucleic acid-binding protein
MRAVFSVRSHPTFTLPCERTKGPPEDHTLKYLLDTSTCIALIQDKYPVRTRLTRAMRSGGECFVSAVSVFELSRQFAKGPSDADGQLLATFLSGPVVVLALEQDDARAASFIEATWVGATILSSSEMLVAGQALARQMVLVGFGASSLAGVQGLTSQDWGKPSSASTP